MMKPTQILIFFGVLLGSFFSMGASTAPTLKIDLRNEWLMYSDGAYQPIATGSGFGEKVVYIEIDLLKNPNSFLQVTSSNSFSIFVNGALSMHESKEAYLSLDSIRDEMGRPSILVAIFQGEGAYEQSLKTFLVKQHQEVGSDPIIERAPTYFRDFVVIGVIVILLFLILIVGQNPKLAGDYFSIRKLVGVPGSQDSLGDSRTTSSSNILFQSFCSVLGGFLLTILFTSLKDRYAIATIFIHNTFLESILIWMVLSAIILACFFTKQLIIYLFAYLFGIKELAVAHYFNLVRLLFWVLGLSAAGISIYLIMHGDKVVVFEKIYFLLGWILGFWVVLIFFKLSRRVGFSMFHLFSYLCATEIIPLIITIKVLYY